RPQGGRGREALSGAAGRWPAGSLLGELELGELGRVLGQLDALGLDGLDVGEQLGLGGVLAGEDALVEHDLEQLEGAETAAEARALGGHAARAEAASDVLAARTVGVAVGDAEERTGRPVGHERDLLAPVGERGDDLSAGQLAAGAALAAGAVA